MRTSWARGAAVACAMLIVMARAASAGVWHVGARGGLSLTTLRGEFALNGWLRSENYPDLDVGDDMKPLDLGGTAGVGVRIPTDAGRVDVEARYATGFTDLWEVSNNLGSINHGFALTLSLSH